MEISGQRLNVRVMPRTEIRITQCINSELIASEPSVHWNHGTSDIARKWRGKEYGEHGQVLRLAPIADWNFRLSKAVTIVLRVIALDLFAHDPTGRDTVDGDTVRADLA